MAFTILFRKENNSLRGPQTASIVGSRSYYRRGSINGKNQSCGENRPERTHGFIR